ncbi:uncharacterized protein GIQ15_04236 [Arthroderma uncinatum]|uniref:uncharacterized protein n=1 Tax=Arthroderma uncinatum TaxID=74035 RepID=UPI00144A74FC|nr:uncharacterized protein GIQ15_04236 [Arthroderma uncinatum]KAF3481477.1 hypothetical protein GIQ15_04236 [Arthroderma uncinatum]
MDGQRQAQLREALKEMTISLEAQNQHIQKQIQHLNTITSLLCPELGVPSLRTGGSSSELSKLIDATHEAEQVGEDINQKKDKEVNPKDGQKIVVPVSRRRVSNHFDRSYDVSTAFYLSERKSRLPIWHKDDSTAGLNLPSRPDAAVCTTDWKYWRPRVEWGYYTTGRGRPNYVPQWELIQWEDGRWYHIDDPTHTKPLFAGPLNLSRRSFFIPYALSPPRRDEEYSFASLHGMKEQIRSSLGQLFAIPPDARVTLRFEKNQLRQACEDGTLNSYLTEMKGFFAALHDAGGFFRITDLDDFMNFAIYNTCHWIENIPESDWDDFPAGPALAAEEFELNIRPGSYHPVDRQRQVVDERIFPAREWHRVIHCHGLAHIPMSKLPYHYVHHVREEYSKFWKLLFSQNVIATPGFDLVNEALDDMFTFHVNCGRRQQSYNPYQHDWKAFHITWYRITASGEPEESLWKSGTLYQTNQRLQQSAFTAGLFPNKMNGEDKYVRHISNHFYFTLLLLTPLHMDKLGFDETWVNASKEKNVSSPQTLILHFISGAFRDAADSWEEVARHITKILADDEDAALDADKHDRLLFDDNTFSRSRLYFWAVDILETFQECIQDSLLQWDHWWSAWEETLRDFEKYQIKRCATRRRTDLSGFPLLSSTIPTINTLPTIDGMLAPSESEIRRLNQLDAKFKGLLDRTQKLRDGLFSASSVIESRAATDLGQNVKLLTYVSIFYMPIAVSAAIWSINSDYSKKVFGIVTVLIAMATYILVANLNNTAQAMQGAYRVIENWLVKDMAKRPESEYWAAKSQDFKQFRPDRANIMPSKWLILWYFVIKILRFDFLRVAIKNTTGRKDVEVGSIGSNSEEAERGD